MPCALECGPAHTVHDISNAGKWCMAVIPAAGYSDKLLFATLKEALEFVFQLIHGGSWTCQLIMVIY